MSGLSKRGRPRPTPSRRRAQTPNRRRHRLRPPPQLVELDNAAVQRVTALGKRLGRNVVVTDMGDDAVRGYYEDGIIYLNRKQLAGNGGDPLNSPEAIVLKHELTHALEGGKSYARLSQFVIKYAKDSGAITEDGIAAFKADVKAQYEARGQTYTDKLGTREFVAAFAQDQLLQDEKAISALVRENSGIAGRILNWAQYQLARLQLRGSGTASEKALLNIERLYTKAFAEAGKQPSSGVREYSIISETGMSRIADRLQDAGYEYDPINGSDDYMRQYLSDADAQINVRMVTNTSGKAWKGKSTLALTDVLTYPADTQLPTLYDAYPELNDVRVAFLRQTEKNGESSKNGAYDHDKKTIIIYSDGAAATDGAQFCTTFMHEVQHAVQAIERNNGIDIALGSNRNYAYAHLVSQTLEGVASRVNDGGLSHVDAVTEAAELIREVASSPDARNGSRAVYDDYRNDLGEQEARSTGEGYNDLRMGMLEDAYLAEEMRSIHDTVPPNISGDIHNSYAVMQAALEKIGIGSLDNLERKAQDNTISSNERVILDAARFVVVENAEASASASPISDEKYAGTKMAEKSLSMPLLQRQGGMGKQDMGARRLPADNSTSPVKDGGLTSTRNAPTQSWESYFNADGGGYDGSRRYSLGGTWDELVQKYGAQAQGMAPRAVAAGKAACPGRAKSAFPIRRSICFSVRASGRCGACGRGGACAQSGAYARR